MADYIIETIEHVKVKRRYRILGVPTQRMAREKIRNNEATLISQETLTTSRDREIKYISCREVDIQAETQRWLDSL